MGSVVGMGEVGEKGGGSGTLNELGRGGEMVLRDPVYVVDIGANLS